MQDIDKQEANMKLVLGTIFFPNQMQARFFHQTKCMQDMDGKGANAKLVQGTYILSKPNACKNFSPDQMLAGYG